ncbi:polysaccharide pyruvyl transferase family protein [Salinicola sp. 4072]|uniref:polysaccharide pyruvyl transferase family protein n=1 Tax=Salinicola sp. 4072 TaxID=3082157 RepID=UPI002FC85FD1
MIYLVSGAGGPNFGDDLILALWIRYYRERGYTGPILVDFLNNASSIKLHSEDKNVYFSGFLKSMTKGREGDFSHYINVGKSKISENLDGFSESIKQALGVPRFSLDQINFIHVLGGGYINGVWENSFSLLGAVSQLKKISGVKIFATGLGLSPLKPSSDSDFASINKIVRSFDFFEIRDIDSYNQISGFMGFSENVIYGLDDNFLYPIKSLVRRKRSKSLHISGFSKTFQFASDGEIISFLKNSSKEYDRILFWLCNKSDVEIANKMQSLFPGLKKLTNNMLVNVGIPFGPEDAMLTARFHPHFMAARAGVGGQYIANSQFYKSKHMSILDLGSGFEKFNSFDSFSKSRRGHLVDRDAALVRRKRLIADHIFTHIK